MIARILLGTVFPLLAEALRGGWLHSGDAGVMVVLLLNATGLAWGVGKLGMTSKGTVKGTLLSMVP